MTRQTPASVEQPGERHQLLVQLESWLEGPMVFLSFVWLVLLIAELVWGELPLLETFGTAIWIAFVVEFGIRLWLAPDKPGFLRANVVTIIALAVPAFRLLRTLRGINIVRAARGIRLVRIVATVNRSMTTLRVSMQRRGLGYTLAVSTVVVLLGAAGMLAFEPAHLVEGGFTGYGDALWWTSMLVTSLGSDFWPQTAEGRILCFLLSLYGFAVFGYITAAFATFFLGQDAAAVPERDPKEELSNLRQEITALRTALERQPGTGSGSAPNHPACE